jgi:hypothetical protein
MKRWHAILGLLFGLATCTWAFSGNLSMDPFPKLLGDTPGRENVANRIQKILHGGPLDITAFRPKHPREALAQVGSALQVMELEFSFFAGEPIYLAREAPYRSRIVPVLPSHEAILEEASRERIVELVKEASKPDGVEEIRVVSQYEVYYLDRTAELPLPVLSVRLRDPAATLLYVDPKSVQVMRAYTSRSRWNRWLYHGLHSLDLPWLYRNRPAWDAVVLILMLGGTALCTTSVIIGFQLLRRTLGVSTARSRVSPPS